MWSSKVILSCETVNRNMSGMDVRKVPFMALEPMPLQLLHHQICSNSISFINFIAFSGPYLNFLLTASHQNESFAATLLVFKYLFFFEPTIWQYPEALALRKVSEGFLHLITQFSWKKALLSSQVFENRVILKELINDSNARHRRTWVFI